MSTALAFSRRDLLKTGGALLVGFSLTDAALGQSAPNLNGPDPARIDSWLAIHADNTATLFLGKVELGQGNTTALLQVAAEELDFDLGQMNAARLDTRATPNQGATVSSSSMDKASPQIRAAAAEARMHLLELAATRLQVPPDRLVVAAGVVHVADAPDRALRYADLLGDQPFATMITGKAQPKPVAAYRLVGSRVPRIDLAAKLTGTHIFMQNLRLPGMLHGRVVRPAGQGAYGQIARIARIDESSIAHLPDVRLLRKNDFLVVVAAQEWHAVQAAQALQVQWQRPAALSGDAALHERMRAAKTVDSIILETGAVDQARQGAAHTASARYQGPYQSHGPFAPNCAVADVTAERAEIYSSTQDIFTTRLKAAKILGMRPELVQVQYYAGSGTYGHSCYHDAAQAAALASQLAGKPVRLQFSRQDELGWDNFGPAHLAEVSAASDAEGRLLTYEYHGWQHGWISVEASEQLALGTVAEERTSGPSIPVNKMNCGAMYQVANRRLVNHNVPILSGYLKGSYLRSPLDLSFSFASEQTIDALARAAGLDALEFRRRNITDARWRAVLEAVTQAAGWQNRLAAAHIDEGRIVKGRGLALGTHLVSYGAAVAEVELDRQTGKVVATRLFGALDCGLAVNPGIVEAQITGMMVQATSRMLKEEVRFDQTGVTSLDWESYPVLRFSETPVVTPIVLQRLDQASTGAGEEVMGATAAAIANAVFDATGVRMTEYPLTPARVRAALDRGKA